MRGDTASAEERLAQLDRRRGDVARRLSEIDRRLSALGNERERLTQEHETLQARITEEAERADRAETRRAELTNEARKRPTSRDEIVDRLYHKYHRVLGPAAPKQGGTRAATAEQRKVISDKAGRLDERRRSETEAEDAVQACLEAMADLEEQSEWAKANRELEKALAALKRIRRENAKAWAELDVQVGGDSA